MKHSKEAVRWPQGTSATRAEEEEEEMKEEEKERSTARLGMLVDEWRGEGDSAISVVILSWEASRSTRNLAILARWVSHRYGFHGLLDLIFAT